MAQEKINDETGEVTTEEPTALEVRPMAGMAIGEEIDRQVTTAKVYPRNIKTFRDRSITLVTLDQETAAACMYSFPRAGKNIEGPSARFAEIVAGTWGNARVDTRPTGHDMKFAYAEAITWDLESNVAIRVTAQRKILIKKWRLKEAQKAGLDPDSVVPDEDEIYLASL